MKNFKELSNEQLKNTVGGGGISIKINATFGQIRDSICGFMDGITGKPNKGKC